MTATPPALWHYDDFWQKTKVFAERALLEDRDSEQFAVQHVLTLELLGRATLAFVHPVLLADAKAPVNMLAVFGKSKDSKPKSRSISEVWRICEQLIPEFTVAESHFASVLADRRNEEFHGSVLGFSGYTTNSWLADYYRLCKMLLGFQSKTLCDLFGEDEGTAAEKMLEAKFDKTRDSIQSEIMSKKSIWEALSQSEQKEKLRDSTLFSRLASRADTSFAKCPVCSNNGLLRGELISTTPSKIEEGRIMVLRVYLPSRFDCCCCLFTVDKLAHLSAIDLGHQFTVRSRDNPIEYFGIEPSDFEEVYAEEFGDD